MPGLLEIDCDHYARSEWEQSVEVPVGFRSWQYEEAHEERERLRARQVVSITEWLEQAARSITKVVPLEKRFQEQADKWRRETEHLSSPSQMMIHPSYQAILGMAQENKDLVISLLLHDLQKNRRPWFWALSYLTQDNPINPSDAGKVDKMIKAWVEWGKLTPAMLPSALK